jgi:hypothetical protein
MEMRKRKIFIFQKTIKRTLKNIVHGKEHSSHRIKYTNLTEAFLNQWKVVCAW